MCSSIESLSPSSGNALSEPPGCCLAIVYPRPMAKFLIHYTGDQPPRELWGGSFVINGDWLTILDTEGKAKRATRIGNNVSHIERVEGSAAD